MHTGNSRARRGAHSHSCRRIGPRRTATHTPTLTSNAAKVGEAVHEEVCVPLPQESLRGGHEALLACNRGGQAEESQGTPEAQAGSVGRSCARSGVDAPRTARAPPHARTAPRTAPRCSPDVSNTLIRWFCPPDLTSTLAVSTPMVLSQAVPSAAGRPRWRARTRVVFPTAARPAVAMVMVESTPSAAMALLFGWPGSCSAIGRRTGRLLAGAARKATIDERAERDLPSAASVEALSDHQEKHARYRRHPCPCGGRFGHDAQPRAHLRRLEAPVRPRLRHHR